MNVNDLINQKTAEFMECIEKNIGEVRPQFKEVKDVIVEDFEVSYEDASKIVKRLLTMKMNELIVAVIRGHYGDDVKITLSVPDVPENLKETVDEIYKDPEFNEGFAMVVIGFGATVEDFIFTNAEFDNLNDNVNLLKTIFSKLFDRLLE